MTAANTTRDEDMTSSPATESALPSEAIDMLVKLAEALTTDSMYGRAHLSDYQRGKADASNAAATSIRDILGGVWNRRPPVSSPASSSIRSEALEEAEKAVEREMLHRSCCCSAIAIEAIRALREE